ncbi:MAG: AmpG family muropeptide MFS transporter [Rhodospirillales bacterium]|jgi:MFS transporter, PAT family, beta-lactamase induction signal transducer AmpG|nr:AmpG family muropeptide MFS transporter [Rhodospirillales bacterium]
MQTWLQSAKVYLDRRVITVLFLGFSSGLPILLVYSTLSAWLSEAGVSKTAIGLFSWASIAYGFKYLWSPLVDRMPLPLLTSLLGQRRGWMIFSQFAVIAGMLGLGSSDPSANLWIVAFWAVTLAFASATQDIVIDAYRVEILDIDQLGAGAGNIVMGYRIGMVAAGGGALVVADVAGWFWAYAAMAGLMGIGVITVLLTPEPKRVQTEESKALEERGVAFMERNAHLPGRLQELAGWIYKAVVCPFADFMTRPNWIIILLFIAFYKYGDALLGVMANPFYLEIGFSKTEIGVISKGYGVLMTIAGGLLGGIIVFKWGILRALLFCGVLQGLSNLIFAAQAYVGYSVPMLTVTISVENFTGGMGTAAFVAYLSSLCNLAYTATQYALVSSFMAFARTIFASGGGWLADNVDWVSYFIITTGAALPGLALLIWMMRKFPPQEAARAEEP